MWISVEERVPPVNHEVLYFAKDEVGKKEIMTGHRTCEGYWTHCCLFFSTMVLNDNVTVTHWMELPDYPSDEPCTHQTTQRVNVDTVGIVDICDACHLAIPPEVA